MVNLFILIYIIDENALFRTNSTNCFILWNYTDSANAGIKTDILDDESLEDSGLSRIFNSELGDLNEEEVEYLLQQLSFDDIIVFDPPTDELFVEEDIAIEVVKISVSLITYKIIHIDSYIPWRICSTTPYRWPTKKTRFDRFCSPKKNLKFDFWRNVAQVSDFLWFFFQYRALFLHLMSLKPSNWSQPHVVHVVVNENQKWSWT